MTKHSEKNKSSVTVQKQALRKTDLTSRSSCKCPKIECARMNGLGEYVCGICDEKLNPEKSNAFAQSRASYYGW